MVATGFVQGEPPAALAPDASGDDDAASTHAGDGLGPACVDESSGIPAAARPRRTSYVGGSVKMTHPNDRPRTLDPPPAAEPSARAKARRRRRSLPLTPAERTNPSMTTTYSVRLPKGSESTDIAKRAPKVRRGVLRQAPPPHTPRCRRVAH